MLEKLFVMYFDSQRYLGAGQNAQKAVFSEFDVCIVRAGSTGSSFKRKKTCFFYNFVENRGTNF